MLLKVEERRRLAKEIQDHLASSPEIRPFPAAVTRVVAACQDASADAKTFEPIIECDPALSVRLLRLANSPIFGLGKVSSIALAVSLLGRSRIKTLAMSVAGANMFSDGTVAKKQREGVWNHSVGCAIVARLLAAHVPAVAAEDAFLGGIFHDVGKLVFFDIVPDEYSALAASNTGAALAEEEELVFGIRHEDVGVNSAHSWDLPKEIKAAIGWHHRPEKSPVHADVAAVMYFADGLAKLWGVGSETVPISDVETEVAAEYELTGEDLEKLQARALKEFDDTMETWSK